MRKLKGAERREFIGGEMLEDYKEGACREMQFDNIGQSKVLDKS